MVALVLNDEQLELLASTEGPVSVRDRHGTEVGVLSPANRPIHLSAEELDEIERRMTADPSTFPNFREAIDRLQARARS